LAGNSVSATLNVTVQMPFTMTSNSPLAGAVDVGVTVKPQVFFSKAVDPTTLNDGNFFASFSGQKLPARIVPSGDGKFAWLFFQDKMPDNAVVQVTVDGSTIRSKDGELLDAAMSGQAGSKTTFDFTTVSLAPVPGTTLSGLIVDPGPDLLPGTADDV